MQGADGPGRRAHDERASGRQGHRRGTGASLPSVSRAVDGLVQAATSSPRRGHRRTAAFATSTLTEDGERLGAAAHRRPHGRAGELHRRRSTQTQRRKLDAALDSLLEREEIATCTAQLKEDLEVTRYRHLITDDNPKWWTLGAMCFALFMIMLDNTVVNVALPSIQQRPRRQPLEPRVDDQRLHAQLRACCWRPAGASATSSAAAGCS